MLIATLTIGLLLLASGNPFGLLVAIVSATALALQHKHN